MSSDMTTIERAFELAKTGEFASVGEIKRRLKEEKFDAVEAHLQGPSISRQLKRLCDSARASESA